MMKIRSEHDVLVVGGGTAGVVAAIAASRNGVNTLLVERYGYLGGMSTGGVVNVYVSFHDAMGKQVVKGIGEEIIDRLINLGASPGHIQDPGRQCYTKTMFDPEVLKIVLLEMVEEAGVHMLLDTYAVDALVQESKFRGIIVENKSGRGVILGSVGVDATGDADIIAMAGAPFRKESKDNMQPVTLVFSLGGIDMGRWIAYMKSHPDQFELSVPPEELDKQIIVAYSFQHLPSFKKAYEQGETPPGIVPEQTWFDASKSDMEKGKLTLVATRVDNVDGTDAEELSRAEIQTQKQVKFLLEFFRENVPGFENSYLLTIAPQIGVRETRQILGEYTVTKEDIIAARKFSDSVAKGATPLDIHGGSKEKGKFYWIKTREKGILAYDIPYRCLVPQGIDGLLVAGRCISATHEAQGSMRMMPVCLSTGQAAGTAAALCVKDRTSPKQVDVPRLQTMLKEEGAVV